ncbi:hypothetical protein [Tenacibaculum sp. IB213877]|uniref:hypothetical protein n=1 Tax=Tenacibaculum sp. IB213877 TaxID=3097351 RepID=UPI002A5AA800|nr:hypothetical protein [Tenacibaculum sp. IB213877]MDY0779707.1 hypothetical protein [Tenacibaculum sp. IB213877]
MDNKLQEFFSNTNFDIHEPHSSHEARFLRKLQQPQKTKSSSWKWLSIAASVILLLGFYLGSYHQKRQYDLADVSPKMAEAQNFFVNTINQELIQVEKYRNIETESIIEDALNEIEELEDQYNNFKSELNNNVNKRLVIQNMISNYQQRLIVLEKLLDQLEIINKPSSLNLIENEII